MQVEIRNWRPGLNTVGLMKTLRDEFGMDLSSAKKSVEALVDCRSLITVTITETDAWKLDLLRRFDIDLMIHGKPD